MKKYSTHIRIDQVIAIHAWLTRNAGSSFAPLATTPEEDGALVLDWWQTCCEYTPDNPFQSAHILLQAGAIACGVLMGSSVMSVALTYTGDHPVNLLMVLAIFVGLPLVTLCLALLIRFIWRKRSTGLGIILSRGMSKADYPQYLEANLWRYGTCFYWLSQQYIQQFTLTFLCTSLITFFFLITFTDIAFGWSSTLQMEAQVVYRITDVLSLPWQIWLPIAHPSLELIEASRFFRMQGHTDPALLGMWWPFVAMCIAVWGVGPRLLMLGVARYKTAQSTHRALLDHPEVTALIHQLRRPTLSYGGRVTPADDLPGDSATPITSSIEAEAKPDVIINWNNARPDAPDVFSIGIGASADDQDQFLKTLPPYPEYIRVLVKGWEPPLLEFLDFVTALCNTTGSDAVIAIRTVALPEHPLEDTDLQAWRTTMAKLRDARVFRGGRKMITNLPPTLAVVGHPNKGKSSIVATLSENSQVQVSPIPGTTRTADHFTLTIGDEVLYDLIDTPGFQRAGQVHNWLTRHDADASSRPELVRRFVDQHEGETKYADECALLRPIIDGAGIIYVVDGSKPYGAEYELEMEILRWTGQPRMALINMIGSTDHRQAWRSGLGQYFSIVREFDAHQASFAQRIALLRAFAELEEGWRSSLEKASLALEAQRQRQLQQASATISKLLQTAIRAKIEKPMPAAGASSPAAQSLEQQLSSQLQAQIRKHEMSCQQDVQRTYRHLPNVVSSKQLELVKGDLFTEQSWQLFGLSRTQLLATGAVSGALAGGAIDLLVGGASAFAGTVIGGALGSLTAWFGGPEIARIKVLGSPLGGDTLVAGPIRDPNFPWVLLGRACLHHTLISERNHAVREQVVADFTQAENFFDFLPTSNHVQLERLFTKIRNSDEVQDELHQAVTQVLTAYREHSATPT